MLPYIRQPVLLSEGHITSADHYSCHGEGTASGRVQLVVLIAYIFVQGSRIYKRSSCSQVHCTLLSVLHCAVVLLCGICRESCCCKMQAGQGVLEDAQKQAEAAAATLIERKFKEPANLEVRSIEYFVPRASTIAIATTEKGKQDVSCAVDDGE